jgi:hypothetical protein
MTELLEEGLDLEEENKPTYLRWSKISKHDNIKSKHLAES